VKKFASIPVAGETMTVFTEKYQTNDRLAVLVYCADGSPFCVPSINVTDAFGIEDDEFVLNHDVQGGVKDDLIACGLFEDTGKRVSYGYVKSQPVWRLKKAK